MPLDHRLLRALPLGIAVLLAGCDFGTDPEPPITRVTVEPESVGLVSLEDTVRLTARAFEADGSERTGVTVTWSTLDAALVSVEEGLTMALANGDARVVASVDGVADTAAVSVRQVAVELAITPTTDTLDALQETRAIEASGQDANGFALAQGAAVAWESLDTAVATVDSDGVLLSRARGTARIRAASGAVADTMTVVVRQVVTSVQLEPTQDVAFLDDTLRVTVVARDANDVIVPDAVIAWTSADTMVASVDATGLVRGRGLGDAEVTATSAEVGATAQIRVRAFPLAAHGSYGCFLDGFQRAQCWGMNGMGQLGDGTTTDSDVPVAVSGGHTFVAIAAGLHHACALTSAGAAYCWGANTYGQLGTTTAEACDGTPCSTQPVPVDGGLTFASLTAGYLNTCAVTEGGEAYCWGDGGGGQLGRGNYVPASEPVPVSGGITFASVVPGSGHACGVATDSTGYCWGLNGHGQLGDNTTATRTTPVAVAGGHDFTSIEPGYQYTCGTAVDGTAYCWGSNEFGKLGDGTTEDRPVPTPVTGGHAFRPVDTSNFVTCGLTPEGAVYCWGYPSTVLLDGTHPGGSVPSLISSDHVYLALAVGGYGVCGVTLRGSVFCGGEEPMYSP